jgi:hypothetical protein
MATRKMTFTLPEGLAAQFVRKVPPRERSHYLAEALTQKLSKRDRRLIRACQAANRHAEVKAIEKEFDSLCEETSDSWAGAPARRRVVGAAGCHARRRN